MTFAIKTAKSRPDLSVTIMTKSNAEASNTQYAQGGIAAVMGGLGDSFEAHIADTLASGGAECEEEIVRMVVCQAPERLRELIELGVEFDRAGSQFDLALEGGHSRRRILHRSDMTGSEIETNLLKKVRAMDNISLLENHFVIDLMADSEGGTEKCSGAFFFDDTGRVRYVRSRITVLSTGGSGQIFRHTTNPEVATGDGVAMAGRLGARIQDMDYVQFHPTAMYEPDQNPCFLLSEALRGFGAHVINADGRRFLFRYDLRGELATRDIVSNAIIEEMAISGTDCVFLDCRHIEPVLFQRHFKSIHASCQSRGFDPAFDVIPVVPVAHYQCGGIKVDKFGQTSVANLFAIGECARTGFHGRNRLASNSLLEAVVFAHNASERVCSMIDSVLPSARVYVNIRGMRAHNDENPEVVQITNEIREVTTTFRLDNLHEPAIYRLRELRERAMAIYGSDICRKVIEAINMAEVALLMIKESKERKSITQKQIK